MKGPDPYSASTMIKKTYLISDFLDVSVQGGGDQAWPTPSPFNLRFKKKRSQTVDQAAAISGAGIYLISVTTEVAYLGSYRPIDGDILSDRLERHLETLTGRGCRIGFGGQKDPAKRLAAFLASVTEPGLRQALINAHEYSSKQRFRDTGVCTTPNRLRFASENWHLFGAEEPARVLEPFTFRLLRIRRAASQEQASREVRDIERLLLSTHRPLCNHEYKHAKHADMRSSNQVQAIVDRIRQVALQVTGSDIAACTVLKGRA